MADRAEFTVTFGEPELQKAFVARHITFLRSISNLKIAVDAALAGSDTTSIDGRVLYFLARMIFEDDLNSIVLLCASRHPNSALRILRGMFERAVTLAYLHKNPAETSLYWNYFRVDRRRRLRDIAEHYPGRFLKERLDQIEESYAEVKADYAITSCNRCDAKRTNYTWSKKNLVAMAKETGFPFEVIEVAYYLAMEESHPKIGAILRRTEEKADGSLWYKDTPPIEETDLPLSVAHWITLHSIAVMKEHFRTEALEAPLAQCIKDFAEAWKGIAPRSSKSIESELDSPKPG